MSENEMKSIYEKIDVNGQAIQKLASDLNTHIKVADVIEGFDNKKIDNLTTSIKELNVSITKADYVKTEELTALLKPVVDSLKTKVSLPSLVGVVGMFAAVVTVILLVALKIPVI